MNNPVTTSVTTSEKKAVTTFEGVLGRLKEATGTKSDSALARALGVKQSSVSSAKQRKQIPTHWVFEVSEKHLFSSDWLFFGIPPKRLAFADQREREEESGGEEKAPEQENKSSEAENSNEVSISELLVKTTKILESRTMYSRALSNNINAFYESVLMEDEIYKIRAEYREVRDDMEKIKGQLRRLNDENKELRSKLGLPSNRWQGDIEWF